MKVGPFYASQRASGSGCGPFLGMLFVMALIYWPMNAAWEWGHSWGGGVAAWFMGILTAIAEIVVIVLIAAALADKPRGTKPVSDPATRKYEAD